MRTCLGAILFGAFAQAKLDNMYTIACVASPQGKVRDTLRICKVPASKPAAPFPHKLSTENSFGGDPALRRFAGTPKQNHPKISCSEVRAVPLCGPASHRPCPAWGTFGLMLLCCREKKPPSENERHRDSFGAERRNEEQGERRGFRRGGLHNYGKGGMMSLRQGGIVPVRHRGRYENIKADF